MIDNIDNPDRAAERLEAALERIARLATVPAAPAIQEGAPMPEAVAATLDGLIERLRAALATPPSANAAAGRPDGMSLTE